MNYCALAVVKFFLISTSMVVSTKSEIFTALVDLEPLLKTEGEIAKTLQRYITEEEQRLGKLIGLKREYERLYEVATSNSESFLSNPINAYLLVKHQTTDWKTVLRLIDGTSTKSIFENISQQGLIFPDDEDLSGSAAAIFRLQDTYLLDTSQLARGEIEGSVASSRLSAADCYELGYQAYKMEDYYRTVSWLQEALNRFEKDDAKTIRKDIILEHLAYSAFMLGNATYAVKCTEDLLEIAPDHPRGHGDLARYQKHLEDVEREKTGEISAEESQPKCNFTPEWKKKPDYERLCRGERLKSHSEESLLYCSYTTSQSSYLLLQPVKEEVLNIDPRIVLYHDVISDKDVEIIKHLSRPKLARAAVRDVLTGAPKPATYRIGKSSLLFDKDHPTIARSSRMIQEITNLKTGTDEELQILNYGIGGHYEPHYDFFKQTDDEGNYVSFRRGNIMATWLYYLSDVDAGGATVFLDARVNVKAKKGSAAFWYNLHKSGKTDMRTRHGGCPVLSGTKWVANKWFREYGQEFRRPCSLNPFE